MVLRIEHRLNVRSVYYKGLRTPHPTLGWTHIPNLNVNIKGKEWLVSIKTNSLGFRDVEHHVKKSNNTIRILLLGDSYVAAIRVPYETTFHQVMKRELERTFNVKIETINLAVGGWTTANEYLAFKEIGVKYEPDIVILVLYIHNDIYENSLKLKGGGPWSWPVFELFQGDLKLIPKERALNYKKAIRRSLIERIFGRFFICRMIYRKILKKGKYPELFDVYLKKYPKEWLDAFRITEKLVMEIYKITKSINARFLVVLAPSPWQMETNRWLCTLKKYPSMKGKKYYMEKPDRTLIKFLKERKINYIWMLPSLRRITKKGKMLYFMSVDHWNKTGEHVVGLLIAKKLKGIIQSFSGNRSFG
jgi:hypothetical protein